MADRLPGILRHQVLELGLGLLVLEMRLPGVDEDAGVLRPGIGSAHIDDANTYGRNGDRSVRGCGRLQSFRHR